jgi:2-polyprenyl-6-methoxyphenol hydroxylase-like FAD-dependent oxidoreductase
MGLAERPQVVIVGAGPAGVVSAITLARYDIPVLLIEKREQLSTLSRSLVISTRSMEIFRAWGLEDAIRAGASDVEPIGWVTAALSDKGGSLFPLGYPTTKEAARISPTRPAWAPQDHLEPLLLDLLQSFPAAQVRFSSELIDLVMRNDSVLVTIHNALTGATHDIEVSYVLAGDGAHSTVRTKLGISMIGRDDLAEFHGVQFFAPLSDLLDDRRYGLNVIANPEVRGVVAPRGRNDRWLLNREWRPGQESILEYSEEQLVRLIQIAAGAKVTPSIERVARFRFAAQIAERYRLDRAFLMGDAAHRMTPRGGTGMNTAIHDAFDIAWKLAWVIRGWAGTDLLDTYEAERRPVGEHNVERSRDPNGHKQQFDIALPWDLNERLPHFWIKKDGQQLSTLDLIGTGLTIVAGSRALRLDKINLEPGVTPPLTTHVLDDADASALGIGPEAVRMFLPSGRSLDESEANALGIAHSLRL